MIYMMHACLQGSQEQLLCSQSRAMNSSGTHFDHSLAHFHLVPLLTTLLSHVWNRTSNTKRRRPHWVAKRDQAQATERIERDSEQMNHFIMQIVMLSQSWSYIDESTSSYKLLYDDAVLYHSQKIFNIIMGYDIDGYFWNAQAPGLASLAVWCIEIDRIRSCSRNYGAARRKVHDDVERRMDRNKCDPMSEYETQRKRFIANYLRSNLGDRNMADYLITYGAPWLLQAENCKTKRALELSTAEKAKIYHLGVNFLRWWGTAMRALSNHNNSLEVRSARAASLVPTSTRDKQQLRKATQLLRALKNGSRNYCELSATEEKLLPLAWSREKNARELKFKTSPNISVLYNWSSLWSSAVASTGACQGAALTLGHQIDVRTLWPTESDAHAEDCDGKDSSGEQGMPKLCSPPGLSRQASTEHFPQDTLAALLPQETSTQLESQWST